MIRVARRPAAVGEGVRDFHDMPFLDYLAAPQRRYNQRLSNILRPFS